MSRRGIRRESDKHKLEKELRREVVRAAERRDGNRCQARNLVTEVKCEWPLDPHEIIPRSAWRAGYLELDNVVMVCRAHHDWIDDNPESAHVLGLHGYSYERGDT